MFGQSGCKSRLTGPQRHFELRKNRARIRMDRQKDSLWIDAHRSVDLVDGTAVAIAFGAATTDQMHARIEMKIPPPEAMGITTRPVMPLNQQHRLAGLRQQCGHAQTADPGANNDHIISFIFGFGVNAAH